MIKHSSLLPIRRFEAPIRRFFLAAPLPVRVFVECVLALAFATCAVAVFTRNQDFAIDASLLMTVAALAFALSHIAAGTREQSP